MRVLLIGLFSLLATVGLAENGIPERRLALSLDVDFMGTDIGSYFDTTLDACQGACMAQSQCTAFTFNQRNGSCFLKSEVTDSTPYEGAVSARVINSSSEAIARAALRRTELNFLEESDIDAAQRLAASIGRSHAINDFPPLQVIEMARDARLRGNTLDAHNLTGSALSVLDTPDLWLDYAELALQFDTDDRALRRKVRARALPAAIAAYLRSDAPYQRASALLTLSEAMDQQGRGRAIIAPLRLAQKTAPRPEIEAALEDAVQEYGFRVTGNSVESDPAQPRACVEFSEELIASGFDYTPYVQLPDPGLALDVSDARICIEGLSHGERIRLALREGLPAASGETLIRTVEQSFYIRDRQPSVRFPGRAYVLPRSGPVAIPVETVNTQSVELALYRMSERNLLRSVDGDYFGQRLSSYWEQSFDAKIAEKVWTGSVDLRSELNVDVAGRIPLSEPLAGQAPGIFVLRAWIDGAPDDGGGDITQWFVLSDHGVVSYQAQDGLTVAVRSLTDASATEGAEVTLLSQANDILGTAMTDAKGIARFAGSLIRGTGGSAPALVTIEKDADLAFLSLTEPAFDLSDRGVEGRRASGPLDLFATTDRGAYRAGETIHATTLLRDAQVKAVPQVPVAAVLSRPDGVEFARHVSAEDLSGGHVFAFPLPQTAPRGTWRLAFYADPKADPLAQTRILVEDFLPERIALQLELPEAISPQTGAALDLDAQYLFGAPATDLTIEGEVTLRAERHLESYPGYEFGRHDTALTPRTLPLTDGAQTDDQGRARLPLPWPEDRQAGQPQRLDVTARVLEMSGRPVERQASAPVIPTSDLIGLKPGFEEVTPEGQPARFTLIGLTPALTPAPMDLSWELNRIHINYQWYRQNGRWNWDPITRKERIATGEVSLGSTPETLDIPVDWGRYELVATRADGLSSSVAFSAGWYGGAETSESPDMLVTALDAERYAPGDTATLRIEPRAPGTAIVTVMSDRILAMSTHQVEAGETLIPLEVTDEWGTGVYISASIIRPADQAGPRTPIRALGIAHAGVDPGAKALGLTLDLPPDITPRQTLSVGAQIDGLPAGETAYITLAAVDLGILNLTNFSSPDPQGHYFGQRALGVELRDLYGRLLDASQGEMGQLRSGGDGAGLSRAAPPPTQELLSVFSGPVTFDANGYAEIDVPLPAFNGTVRIMGVAWSETTVGQASQDVLVRDPVVLNVSMPRFVAPGDRSEILLELTHTSGPGGEMALEIDPGTLRLNAPVPPSVTLAQGGRAQLRLPFTARDAGQTELTVTLTPPQGAPLSQTQPLAIQANDPPTVRQNQLEIAPGETFVFDNEIFDGLRPGTGTATLSVGPLARFDAPGLLHRLQSYPYGCSEQLVSKAMPLLYLDPVSRALDLPGTAPAKTRLTETIAGLLGNQARNGAFGLWSPSSGDLWLDAYVTDFFSRSRAQGITVPDSAYEQALTNLQNEVNYYPDFDQNGDDLAYALMVLAREGRAAIGDLRYFADEKDTAFSPLGAAQLGVALAYYGEQTRADHMFTRASDQLDDQLDRTELANWRYDYGSTRRDSAAVLALATEAGNMSIDRARLIEAIARPADSLSTQEASWSLLATHALVQDFRAAGVTFDGAPPNGPLVRRRSDARDEAPLRVTNISASPIALTVTSFGVPEQPEPLRSTGMQIDRRTYLLDGTPVDPSSLRSGERLVVVLTVVPFEGQQSRLMINDPLPAGFEIDNPHLLQSGDISGFDWLETTTAQQVEFRAERFLAAVEWRSDSPFSVAYIARAARPGDYHHPAASVEDMYRPQLRAQTISGRIRVRE